MQNKYVWLQTRSKNLKITILKSAEVFPVKVKINNIFILFDTLTVFKIISLTLKNKF